MSCKARRCWSESGKYGIDILDGQVIGVEEREWTRLALNEEDKALGGQVMAGPLMWMLKSQ